LTRPASFADSSPEEDFDAFGLEVEDQLSESFQSLLTAHGLERSP